MTVKNIKCHRYYRFYLMASGFVLEKYMLHSSNDICVDFGSLEPFGLGLISFVKI